MEPRAKLNRLWIAGAILLTLAVVGAAAIALLRPMGLPPVGTTWQDGNLQCRVVIDYDTGKPAVTALLDVSGIDGNVFILDAGTQPIFLSRPKKSGLQVLDRTVDKTVESIEDKMGELRNRPRTATLLYYEGGAKRTLTLPTHSSPSGWPRAPITSLQVLFKNYQCGIRTYPNGDHSVFQTRRD